MKKTKRLVVLAILTATALVLFMIELAFPSLVPVPGVKLGLANIVTVYTIFVFSKKETFLVLVARILLGALLSGRFLALIYSLSGGLLCFIAACIFSRIFNKSQIWILSVIGAVFHNIGQIAAAAAVTETLSVLAYLPALIIFGIISGFITGVAAQLLVNRLDLKNFNI